MEAQENKKMEIMTTVVWEADLTNWVMKPREASSVDEAIENGIKFLLDFNGKPVGKLYISKDEASDAFMIVELTSKGIKKTEV